MNNLWLIIIDIILIISNIFFVITKTGHWQLNFVAAICLTIAVSLMIANNIFKKGKRK